MFKYIPLFLIIFSLSSCYHENVEVVPLPEKKLTPAEMVDILTDLQLAEGILTFRRIEKLPVANYGESLYDKIISEHHLTRKQLQENLDFYNNDPKLMEKIYDDVLARLNKMQSELEMQAAKLDSIQKVKTDSIQRLDSVMQKALLNFVSIQKYDSIEEATDTVLYWNYQGQLKIPGFIY